MEKRQATPWIWCVKCTCKHLPMTPVWMETCVLEVRHWAVFFWGWCCGVMDSAGDFDLLDESVPQVRVSARAFALLGFLTCIYSDSLLSSVYMHIYIFIYLFIYLFVCINLYIFMCISKIISWAITEGFGQCSPSMWR